jgi:CDP-diacylglycerol--glycerol-3-phosphate 3-phosphatidyltransferase
MPRSFTILPHSVPRRVTDPIVGVLARIGVTPNHITTVGFAGNVAAGVFAALGDFVIAGVIMLVFSALDLLDGALARATGKASAFGAVYDSVLDRLSEAAVLAGLVWYYGQKGDSNEEIALCFAALVGSIMVSYVRARAQTVGYELREGLFTRAERVILLAGGLIIEGALLDGVRITLWVLAIMANVTAVQRLIAVRQHFEHEGPTTT